MVSEALQFYAFATITVLGSLLVVSQRNPVYSVLALIAAFFGLSGLYVGLDAPFVAVIQIIIYAGAIMVLFLFVVMLLNVPREDAAEWDQSHPLYRHGAVRVGAALALLMVVELGWAFSRTSGLSTGVGDERRAVTSIAAVGRSLCTDYMFACEVTSLLIIIAMVGAVVLAKKRDE